MLPLKTRGLTLRSTRQPTAYRLARGAARHIIIPAGQALRRRLRVNSNVRRHTNTVMRSTRNFNARSREEQRALIQDTWCDVCSKPDLGLASPVEYEEDGVVYVSGLCAVCSSPVLNEVSDPKPTSTAPGLRPYDLVTVIQLMSSETDRDGWHVNQRAPAIGDIGTVVEILRAQGVPNKYVVECVIPDGQTIWLTEFLAEELARVAQ